MGRPVKGFDRTVLKRVRESRGASLDDLAVSTGICRTLLWRYETGRVRPTRYNLDRLATALRVPPEQFCRMERPFDALIGGAVEQACKLRPRRMSAWVYDRSDWYRVPRLFQLMPTECRTDFRLPVEQFALFRLWWHSNRNRKRGYSRQFSRDESVMAEFFWREQLLLAASPARGKLYQGTSDYQWGDHDDNMEMATRFYLLEDRRVCVELAQYGFEQFLKDYPTLRPYIVQDA